MRRFSTWLVGFLFLGNMCVAAEIAVNQYAPCWFIGHDPNVPLPSSPLQPNQMVFENWTPETDPYLQSFYRGLPPKMPRFASLPSKNGTFTFVPLMCFSASKTPTQWKPSLDTEHLFWDWNLLGDSFVYFGGSDSEGQLVIPPAGLIRAAHLQGVSIYGTVFFSETSPAAWVESFLTKNVSDNAYPAADRLLALAQAYQLDGFFINQESFEARSNNADFIPFMQYFNQQAQAVSHGQDPVRLSWYDLNQQPDVPFMSTQSALFVNYGWSQADVAAWASAANENQFPLADLQFGINLEVSIYYTFPGIFGLVSQALAANNSCNCALFDPSQIVRQGQATAPDLTTALTRVGAFYEGVVASSFVPSLFSWSQGILGIQQVLRPKVVPQTTPSVATTVTAYSSLVGDGFSSTFNLGQGNQFFVDGALVSAQPWWEPGLQDLNLIPQWFLPTGAITAQVTAAYNTQMAFTGGSSLNWTGSLQMDPTLTYTLYQTDLSVEAGSQLQVAYWGGQGQESVLVESKEGALSTFVLPTGGGNQWMNQVFSIVESIEVQSIKIQFSNGEKGPVLNFNLGLVAIQPPGLLPPDAPTSLQVQATQGAGSILLWDPKGRAVSYEIRSVSATGGSAFIARVSTPAYFFDSLAEGAVLEVASVGATGLVSAYTQIVVKSLLQDALDDSWVVDME